MYKNNIEIVSGGLTAVKGIETAGIRYGNYGLCIIKSNDLDGFKNIASGLFTSNNVVANPVIISRENIKDGKISAIVANSGNANCFTGDIGFKDSKDTLELVSKKIDVNIHEILIASTGVIGRKMPMDIIKELINDSELGTSADDSLNSAKAIMTTDTKPKEIAIESSLTTGEKFRIAGIAKGSGMIEPNMATMLCFLVTDVKIKKNILDSTFKEAIDESFNMLSVDGDESTNDTSLIIANGRSYADASLNNEVDINFKNALSFICVELTKMMAKDGEGANKFLEVEIKNAKSKKDSKIAAKSVVNSSLVKTAIFGGDPNWGRIVTALGYSGCLLDLKKLSVSLENIDNLEKSDLVLNGEILGFEGTDELQKAEDIMKSKNIRIIIDLDIGNHNSKAYGCDLSYEYVKINADYTT